MPDFQNLAINPIKFVNIEYIFGKLNENWGRTDYFLSKHSTQNILYSTYHEPKNIIEIAKSLSIPKDFVADEVHYLETNGFLEKTNKDKYLSNILIHDLPKDILGERHHILNRYAKIVLEKYVPLILDQPSTTNYFSGLHKCESLQLSTLNCQLSTNFLLWTLISFALDYKITFPAAVEKLKKHFTKHFDGSEYLITGMLDKDEKLTYNPYKYKYQAFSNIQYTFPERLPIEIWLSSTYYDNRSNDWKLFLGEKILTLYNYLNNIVFLDPNEKAFTKHVLENNDNIYAGDLSNTGFLIYPENDPNPFINLLLSPLKKEELLASLPNMPDDFSDLNNKLASELFNLTKSQYPDRMQEILYDFCQNSLASGEIITRVIEQALHYNILLPLSDIEKKTVNMIMFI